MIDSNDTQTQQPRQATGQRGWMDMLMHRWPTTLGVAVAVLTTFDEEVDAGFVSSLSALIVVMALVYLGAAALDRRWFAWPLLLAGLVVIVVLRWLNVGLDPAVGLLIVAFVFLVVGVARGQWRKPGGLTLQTVGMLGFGVVALVALSVNPDLGGYLVAAGLIGHAAWDAIHLRLNRVVARSYAEFCAVVDLVLGVTILFLM